jgi:hypothetical protein
LFGTYTYDVKIVLSESEITPSIIEEDLLMSLHDLHLRVHKSSSRAPMIFFPSYMQSSAPGGLKNNPGGAGSMVAGASNEHVGSVLEAHAAFAEDSKPQAFSIPVQVSINL